MAIAREAWLPVTVAIILAGFIYHFWGLYYSLPIIIIAISLLYVFRDPERNIPPSPLGIVSPVDGHVIEVEQVIDPFLERKAYRISVRVEPLGPWIVRSSMEGRVMQKWYLPNGPDSHLLNRTDIDTHPMDPCASQPNFVIWIQSDEQDDVVIVLRGVYILRRLRCSIQAGERIGQGQRYALLLFIATADIYIPVTSLIDTRVGGTVRAGSDIIATLVHKE